MLRIDQQFTNKGVSKMIIYEATTYNVLLQYKVQWVF